MVLLHDGSFEGLMTAIYEAYYSKQETEGIFYDEDYIPNLMDMQIMIFPDTDKSNKVITAILSKLGQDVFQHVLYVYYSENINASDAIYKFLKLALKRGADVIGFRAHPEVGPFLELYRSVIRESHRMLGLIRFIELDSGILLSQYETDYNLITVLSAHFHNRLSGQKWILHDIKRGIASISNGDKWEVIELDSNHEITVTQKEYFFQELWRTYYNNIAITERINPRLQMQMMPKKYWAYLTEKNTPRLLS